MCMYVRVCVCGVSHDNFYTDLGLRLQTDAKSYSSILLSHRGLY